MSLENPLANLPVPSAAQLAAFRRKLGAIAPLPDVEWNFFQAQLRALHLRKGEALTETGDTQLLAAFVVKGVFRAYYFLESGDEVVRGFNAEDDFLLAYASALKGEPSNVTIEALEEAELIVTSYNQWRALYPRHSCWQEMGRKQAEHAYLLREQHSRDLMTKTAAQRLESFKAQFPEIYRRVAQKHIASYLHIDQATLSRLRGSKAK